MTLLRWAVLSLFALGSLGMFDPVVADDHTAAPGCYDASHDFSRSFFGHSADVSWKGIHFRLGLAPRYGYGYQGSTWPWTVDQGYRGFIDYDYYAYSYPAVEYRSVAYYERHP